MSVVFCHTKEKTFTVCRPPEAPFFQIPACISKSEGEYFIGDEAIERSSSDPETKLYWVYELHSTHGLPEDEANFLYANFFGEAINSEDVRKSLVECSYRVYSFPFYFDLTRFRANRGSEVEMQQIFITDEELAALSTVKNLGRMNDVQQLGADTSRDWRISINMTSNRTNICGTIPFCDNGICLDVGIDTIFNFFVKLLCEKGYDFTSTEGQEICKEKLFKYCFVSSDFEKDCLKVDNNDGVLYEVKVDEDAIVELGKECFLAPEILFNPSLIGIDGVGLHQSIVNMAQRPEFIRQMTQPAARNGQIVLLGSFAEFFLDITPRLNLELEQQLSITTISTVDVDQIFNSITIEDLKFAMSSVEDF